MSDTRKRRVGLEIEYHAATMSGEAIVAFIRGVLSANALNVRMTSDIQVSPTPTYRCADCMDAVEPGSACAKCGCTEVV